MHRARTRSSPFLLRGADPHGTEDAYRVHFERRVTSVPGRGNDAATTSIFERQCGPCHRALTPSGSLGTGAAGPNLAGLFTPFYPRTAPTKTKTLQMERA